MSAGGGWRQPGRANSLPTACFASLHSRIAVTTSGQHASGPFSSSLAPYALKCRSDTSPKGCSERGRVPWASRTSAGGKAQLRSEAQSRRDKLVPEPRQGNRRRRSASPARRQPAARRSSPAQSEQQTRDGRQCDSSPQRAPPAGLAPVRRADVAEDEWRARRWTRERRAGPAEAHPRRAADSRLPRQGLVPQAAASGRRPMGD